MWRQVHKRPSEDGGRMREPLANDEHPSGRGGYGSSVSPGNELKMCPLQFIAFTLILTFFAVFAVGCTKTNVPHPDAGNAVSIAYLKSMYEREPVTVTGDIYINARVISTDQYGNFYKTLMLEDDTGGIAMRIDLDNYHRTYYRGMRLRVACNALVISSYGGMLQLGAYAWTDAQPDLGRISANRLPAVITIVAGMDVTPEPLLLTIPELSPDHIGRFAAFNGVQFADAESGRTWSDPDADTDRQICDREGNTLIIRTSRHAEFAGRLLPSRSGYIEGVVTYFNGNYQLVVCSESAAVMESPRF